MFIPDKRSRTLLKGFSGKGISKEEFFQLEELISANSPSILPLLKYMQNNTDFSLPTVKCPSEWAHFLSSLASPSPVCGLVHPSEELFSILQRIQHEDITRDLSCMRVLQREIPVLFDLLGSVAHFPMESLSQVFERLIEKSKAPFGAGSSESDVEKTDDISGENVLCELSYFPCLPKIRVRGSYHIDSQCRAVGCTKQSGGHPTLLPGIFTLYCPHGELKFLAG